MSTQLVARSSYTSTSLAKADTFDVQAVAEQSAKIAEITKVANHEVMQVGGHAIGTMAQLVQGAGDVRQKLLELGHRSEIFDDAQSKVLQVTGQNIITLANTAQKEILQQATKLMR